MSASAAAVVAPRSGTVSFRNDRVPFTAGEIAANLVRVVSTARDPDDEYLKGGAVAALEVRVAAMFGEDAAFFATGSLANHIALRLLCEAHERVLVQHDSHLHLDEGDSASILGGLTLVPLAPGVAVPSADAVSAAIHESMNGSCPTRIGAISLESPVRRLFGASIPLETLRTIAGIARRHSIRLHWDGARALLLKGTPGFDLEAAAALFDTVYISLYKYLGAPYGALLVGSKELMAKARELRHIHGGTLYQGWQSALVSLDTLGTFEERFLSAREQFESLLGSLQSAGGFAVERVPNASNVVFLRISAERLEGFQERLAAADIMVREPVESRMALTLNVSILRRTNRDLLRAFVGEDA